MSGSSAQSDAARRAAARKAKILARGNTGLTKLAQTARGDEAETLYAQESELVSELPMLDTALTRVLITSSAVSPHATPSPAPPSSTKLPPRPPSTGPFTPSQSRPAPSAGQATMSSQLEAMMSMFGGPAGGEGGMPDMQRLMAQMMGADSSGVGAGLNLLGDLDDSAGLDGRPMPPLNFPGAMNGLSGLPTIQKKSRVERYFPLIHALSVVALLVFVVGWWEPTLRSARWPTKTTSQGLTGRWAGLARRNGVWKGVQDELAGEVEVLVRLAGDNSAMAESDDSL